MLMGKTIIILKAWSHWPMEQNECKNSILICSSNRQNWLKFVNYTEQTRTVRQAIPDIPDYS